MKLRFHFLIPMILFCWTTGCLISPLHAQMTAVVNSNADDEFAYAWDDTLTENIDESVDGICMDEKRRCTLRAAISEAWNIGIKVHVTFSFTGTIIIDELQGPFSPPPESYIEGQDQRVTIQGSGASSFLMTLDSLTWVRGLIFRDAVDGIVVTGRYNVIGGVQGTNSNVFLGMTQHAILIAGDSNQVAGNYIGISPNGNTLGNQFGVFITGSYNKIGHSNPVGRNIISGNHTGISIGGDIVGFGKRNLIVGNYIGTDPTGTQKRPNAIGIEILDAIGTVIGGGDIPPDTLRNVISGNTNQGILVGIIRNTANITVSNFIEDNIIGLDVTKQDYLGNRDGIVLGPGSAKVEIRRNTISGNDSNGIVITGFGSFSGDFSSTGHGIYKNEIVENGPLAGGGGSGIAISGLAFDNIIGDELQDVYNRDGNIIRSNRGSGVRIRKDLLGYEPRSNTIRENYFSHNGDKGINIVDAQEGIQPPMITSATMEQSVVHVSGTHDRVGARIDIYIAITSGNSGLPEGDEYRGGGFVQNDSTFSFNLPPCLCSGERVIATATDVNRNTSEFSNDLAISQTVRHSFHQGANTVSTSVTPTNSSVNSILPGATGNAYSWGAGPSVSPAAMGTLNTGSYIPQDTLVSGVGYWIKYDNTTTESVSGFIRTADTIDVFSGWNFIGSISNPVGISQIVSNPPGMTTSQFFGYDSAYFVTDTIQPGYAYWVKVTTPGSLVLAVYDTLPSGGFITVVPDTALPPSPPPEVLESSASAQVNLNQGWNMVSVPLQVADFQSSALFPDATANIYTYQNHAYAAESTLAVGPGYWVKYGSASGVLMTGALVDLDTFNVASGWNMIGSISSPVPIGQIVSVPGGMVTSSFYGFDQFYQVSDTIIPGRAYWVKVNQGGQLILSASSIAPEERLTIIPSGERPPAPPMLEHHVAPAGPQMFVLEQNYPNPFNPTTHIRFQMPRSGFVSLKVLDLLGREVRMLINETLMPGRYEATFDATGLVSGVYYYRIEAADFVKTKKFLLLK